MAPPIPPTTLARACVAALVIALLVTLWSPTAAHAAEPPTFGGAGVTLFHPGGADPLDAPAVVGAVGVAAADGDAAGWIASADGAVLAFGGAPDLGGVQGLGVTVVGIARSGPDGYWLVADDGGVFAFGDARFHGSLAARSLNGPIVGMAPTPTGDGYWLVAADGGVFAFGDARFHGSVAGRALNRPIVGMAGSWSGGGYWLVADDGGVFAFGDARFRGSTGNLRLNRPVVGMAATPRGDGYWLVAADGGVFAFGDAPFLGSAAEVSLAGPVAALSPRSDGGGYLLAVAAPPPEPEPAPPPLSEAERYYRSMTPGRIATWDRVAQCESTGRWDVSTGNGYYGGVQFSRRSWRLVGGTGYPHHHSRIEQIYRAELLLDIQGWGAWPVCSRRLGLR